MTPFRRVAAVVIVCLSAAALPAADVDVNQPQSPPRPAPKWLKVIDQGTRDPRLKGYLTPEGLKLEVVAEEPAVVNPVGMTFADDGTLFVLEWRPSPGDEWRETPETFTFTDGTKRTVATMKKKVKDVVKVLRHSGEHGADDPGYDRSEVVLEDELPSSILLYDGWLYLSGRGTVRRYRPSKPGGPYDVKEVIAQGFCGFHHHQVSGLTVGNDGWLYVTSGDDDNVAEGSDGTRATVLRTGGVFRCRPDGSGLRAFALGFRNPYRDVAFDSVENIFHADNDNEDGSKFTGCRLMHVPEGADFGWRLRQGARCCSPDAARGAVFGELPGKMPPLLKTGRGAPAGLLIYNDTRLPERYRGLLLYPDAFRKLIRAYRVEPRGATFEVVEEFEFLKSDDPLFRPCQMVVGPDGAVYVCDWRTDSGGAGRLWGDGVHGRVYRISWGGTKDEPAIPLRGLDSWTGFAKMSEDDLLKALARDDFSDRRHAQAELRRRGEKNRPALLKILDDAAQPLGARVAALGALQSFWSDEVRDTFIRRLSDPRPDVRRLAADGLSLNCGHGDRKAHDALLQQLGDPEPAVRRAVALAMGQIGAEGAADDLVNALAFDDGRDVYLRDGLVRSVEKLGGPGVDRLLALAESGAEKDIDRVVETFTALRTEAGAKALPRLLRNPHLSIAQRTALVRSYQNYLLDPPVSLTPLLDYLAGTPEAAPVKVAAAEVLAGSEVLKTAGGQEWLATVLDDPNSAVRIAAYRAVESARLNRFGPKLVAVLGNDKLAATERVAAVQVLRTLGDREAVPALKEIVDQKDHDQKLLPIEALRALGQLDPAAGVTAAKGWLDGKDAEQLRTAVQVLAATPDGAKLAGRAFLDRKLPGELQAAVADGLRRHAEKDAEAAKMLGDLMKTALKLTLSTEDVARVRELVRTKGDAKRGKQLFLNSKALACINCHRMEGVGGQVGPDLTRLWETQSLEKVLESLLEPSKEIKEGYQSYRATTKKGQTFTGLKVAQTEQELVLRGADGKDVRIAAADLDEVAPSKTSLMPDDVLAHLTLDQFVDLVAFLRDREAQESLRTARD